jgi:cell wall-associated NlpC family hydrolase
MPRVAFSDMLAWPWKDPASEGVGVDCYGLVREFYARGGIILPENPVVDYLQCGLFPAERPYLFGDVLTFNMQSPDGIADHCGVCVGQEMMIHATRARGVTVEPIYRVDKRIKRISHLRHKEGFGRC